MIFLFLSFFRIYDWIRITNRHKQCFTFTEAKAFLMFPSGKFAFLTFSFGLGINTFVLCLGNDIQEQVQILNRTTLHHN